MITDNNYTEKANVLFEKLKAERKIYVNNHNKVSGYAKSYVWHSILLPLLKLLRIINKQHITIIGDERVKTSAPVIYACTHIGFYDVMMLFESIKSPCWLFWGNPNEDLINLFGWMARKNGAILVDSYDKEDRKYAKKEAEMLLRQGGNLMIFPEGAWNVTDNEPVMNLFRGTVSMAINTKAEIVPVAIEQYGKEFLVNIGKNIVPICDDVILDSENQKLRDTLATLKWEIWEKQSVQERVLLPENVRELFINGVFEDAEGKYTYQMIEAERFHDISITSRDEAFEFIKKLCPKKENAFLLKNL